MSELSKLVKEGKKVKLDEIEIEIKPLTVSSMPLLIALGNEEDKDAQSVAMKEIIVKTLKDAVPAATDDEINKIPLEYITPLIEAVLEVNNLQDMELTPQKKELIDKLKAKK